MGALFRSFPLVFPGSPPILGVMLLGLMFLFLSLDSDTNGRVIPGVGVVLWRRISVGPRFGWYRMLIFLGGVVVDLHCLRPTLLVLVHNCMPAAIALRFPCHILVPGLDHDVIHLSPYVSVGTCPCCHVFFLRLPALVLF